MELLLKFMYTHRFQQVTFRENMELRMIQHTNSGRPFHKNWLYCGQSFIYFKWGLKRWEEFLKLHKLIFKVQNFGGLTYYMNASCVLCHKWVSCIGVSYVNLDNILIMCTIGVLNTYYGMWFNLESLFPFLSMHIENVHIDHFRIIMSREVKPIGNRKWMLDESI